MQLRITRLCGSALRHTILGGGLLACFALCPPALPSGMCFTDGLLRQKRLLEDTEMDSESELAVLSVCSAPFPSIRLHSGFFLSVDLTEVMEDVRWMRSFKASNLLVH